MTLRLPEQVRLRLREELTRKKLSQRDLANLLGWSQSRVAKLLTGRVEMSIGDLEALCFATGLAITEVVRDHGLEFCAEMTPTELRLLETIRQLPTAAMDGLLQILNVKTKTNLPERRATPAKATTRRKMS